MTHINAATIQNSEPIKGYERSIKMRAADVMVTNVITVRSDTSVREIAEILLANRISAVPVLDKAGNMVGIVSEGDLIHRVEVGTERHPSWWLEFMAGKQTLAQEFIKSHARRAADLMTRNVITVKADTPLGELASLLDKHRIKRVPVVDDSGKIIGIVSRANLVQALINLRPEIAPDKTIGDSVLRGNILAQLRSEPWWPGGVEIIVHSGAVELWGIVESQVQKDAIRIAIEVMPGVRTVSDNLSVQQRVQRSL
ncbi:MAG: CBS domain-containing protein [Pseudolabrys sp.]